MAETILERLREYLQNVGRQIELNAQASSVLPNPVDLGGARERAYGEFLRAHLPAQCQIEYGGFVFDQSGQESKQIDIIVKSTGALNFNYLRNPGTQDKSFSCIDGVMCVATVKSTLDKQGLEDALTNLASLPEKVPFDKNTKSPSLTWQGYDHLPYKIVFGFKGNRSGTLLTQVRNFYELHPDIPVHKRPDLIHVANGGCLFVSEGETMTSNGAKVLRGSYIARDDEHRIFGYLMAMRKVHTIGIGMSMLGLNYDKLWTHFMIDAEAVLTTIA